ncbi:MAG: nucleotidyltransferase domain-containing protein [Thermodesulfobacteriota bacterium]|jgi:predicted nucleotidyltransferase
MRLLAENEEAALQEAKREISRRFSLVTARLFGSKARGTADAESDVDVLFVLESLDWEVERAVYEICFHAGLEHDTLLAPVVMSRQEAESPLTKATPFYQTVEREGVTL